MSVRDMWLSAVAVLLVLLILPANATSLAITRSQGVTITLTDEPAKCDAVPTFNHRVTWEEPGKKFEGCFSIYGPIVVAYFPEDKSIAVIPAQAFERLIGS